MDNPLKVSLENIIPLTEARDHFSQIVAEVQKDKLYVLTKGGKPAVAIIDVKYLEALTGGEVKKENIQEEIKKDPEKVGLPPMVEHSSTQPSAMPVIPPEPRPFSPLPPKPTPPPPPVAPKPTPPTQPEGIKSTSSDITPASTPPPPSSHASSPPSPSIPPTPASAKPAPSTISNTPAAAPKTPAKDAKIDVQFYPDSESLKSKDNRTSPDDKNPPAKFAGKGDGEPEDMSID